MQKDHSKCQVCKQVSEVYIDFIWLNLDLEIIPAENTSDKKYRFSFIIRCYCGLAISAHSHTSPTHALSATSKDTEKDEPEENIESETGYSPNRKGSLLPQGR